MKLIILILIIFSGSVSEAYRLPTLTVRLNIEDPLNLANLVKLFKAFINSIDTNEESNLKQFLNTTKLTKRERESLPRPNPNTFFPYVYYTANSKVISTNSTAKSPESYHVCIHTFYVTTYV